MTDPKLHQTTLRAREEAAAEVLAARGVMISMPKEGNPQSDVYDCWGVCVGSHGGYAKTLKGAMQRCLRCCGIGAWWCVQPPEGSELLSSLFHRLCAEYNLGALHFAAEKANA